MNTDTVAAAPRLTKLLADDFFSCMETADGVRDRLAHAGSAGIERQGRQE